ncbi:unnamed protein product [Malus baccata var. baccata]
MRLMSSLDAIYAKDGLLCRSSIFLIIDRNLHLRGSLARVLQGLHLAFDIHKICAVGSRVGLLQFANVSVDIL